MNYHYNLKNFFKDIADRYPDNIALIYPDMEYTYRDLDTCSNSIAYFMQAKGLTQGDVIAIISTKMFEDYALMIACLKLGIAYTNIDIDNPKERTFHILNTCNPKLVFTGIDNKAIKDVCEEQDIEYVIYQNIKLTANHFRDEDIDGDTISYIMFTSGSTGIPKGAAITHQNIIHFIGWTTSFYDITTEDNFANISPLYFDNSVFDFYTALFCGASLTPITKSLLNRPIELVNYIDEKKCTIWFSVPSMLIYMLTMKVLNENNLKNIRIFTFGGEGFPKSELKKLYELYKEHAKFINVYGPTECTCICSSYEITEKDFDNLDSLPPLGQINQNISYVILKNDNISDEGELCLLGPNVSKGYYNDQERTRNAFSLYTGKDHYNKKIYRTGDLVKEEDGLLLFRGRVDNQIKHMGYRIELEEIEVVINSLSEIKQAVATYIRVCDTYGKIVAFLVPEDKDIDIIEIKKQVYEKLPIYMRPNEFVCLDVFPKNANGKVDRRQLHGMYMSGKNNL